MTTPPSADRIIYAYGRAIRNKRGGGFSFKVDCPYCGRTHTHGAADNPYYAGYRVPHCHAPGQPDYFLIIENGNKKLGTSPEETPRFVLPWEANEVQP